ncbi:PQQ-dependent sugar dehydrogenase [Horticoccus sp. 23ND18S-11]|uniref:PQQ-dependent sugar dehydrogenase n=1 Tax=Horticoccus sp. 23ND18S-11 TaxID=3391832 RepID=UPI0039C92A9C
MIRAALLLVLAGTLPAGPLAAQTLTRIPATALRLPATPPATSYATVRAFPTLSFTQPVATVIAPGETRRLFVVEKPGRIWVIPDVTAASPTRTLFLDLTTRIAASTDASDERGLLALAFHPNYAVNGQFFVWYTVNATTSAGTGLHDRLARFRVLAGDANAADAISEQPLLTQRDEASNHNGGQLAFGPDGYLYLSLGDEGGANDQFQNSQRIDRDFFSGVIRLDVDRRAGSLEPNPHPAVHPGTYSVPADNPFVGAAAFNGSPVAAAAVRTEFWAVGLRNPWRFSFDAATGRLWLGDVGQGTREEVNVIVRGGNYGWSYREGTVAGPRGNPPAGASFLPPIWDYPNPSQGSSITGGLVYRGPRLPALVGHYLFADFVSGRIWALNPDGENSVTADRIQLLATDGGISSFGLDPATGDVIVTDLTENALKRLVASPAAGGTPLPATLSATGAFSNLATLTPAAGLVAYEPNVSFWSDHAKKRRWFGLPDATGTFGFSPDGNWSLPTGAVWVKHFDLELTRGNPATSRRIETRFLVKTATGVHGATYRWNDAQTDATLVGDDGAEQTFTIVDGGSPRPQTWRFPGRAECLTCHTSAGGFALSFNTRQLNREQAIPGGAANLITALAQAGYLNVTTTPSPGSLPALAPAEDLAQSLERRARSYVDANCAQCHQPGGTALGHWDARSATPLILAGLLNGPLIDNGGDAANRLIVPGDPGHSRLLQRAALRGPGQMPPIGTHERDLAGESLLRAWITALGTPSSPQPPSRLVNLAARAAVGPGANALIPGFVIGPGAQKTVLVRAIGPALAGAPFNVPGTLPDPQLTLLGPDSATRIAASNDNWNATDAALFSAVGAFALPAGSRDAALVVRLDPGAYTAQITGAGNTSGVALVEVYDADATVTAASSRLINTAVRAQVGSGANVLIPGLVVSDGAPKTVLIRAVGPGIGAAPFNVPGVLAEPVVTLFAGNQSVATNRAWNAAVNVAEIRAAARSVGAFALTEGSRDSALLVTLPPGAYTLQVSGANATAGIALVEVYDVP